MCALNISAEAEAEEGLDKCRKVYGSDVAQEGNVDSKEAAGLGAPGDLVGAHGGTHQEP